MTAERPTDWRTIVALNSASALSQIGQVGIGFLVLPLWAAQHGLHAAQLGVFASAAWAGMLVGLVITPRLTVRFGYRPVVAAGLLLSILAFAVMPFAGWPVLAGGSGLVGLGVGLRWIGLEPWLYRIAPSDARGRLVGVHETLIGIAPILAPALAGWAGVAGAAPFVLGIFFTGLALVPLVFTRPVPVEPDEKPADGGQRLGRTHRKVLALGTVVALAGGLTDAAFAGLFPVFGAGRHLGTGQMVTLLAVFGLGGLLLQYPVGWLADHRGLRFTALVNAVATLVVAALVSLPFGFAGLAAALFMLGGTTTAYLTLAIIAATQAGDGDLSLNVRRISIVYTASSIFGPLIAGTAMKALGSEAFIWMIGALALALCTYLPVRHRPAPAARPAQDGCAGGG
jgi:MFS family permease